MSKNLARLNLILVIISLLNFSNAQNEEAESFAYDLVKKLLRIIGVSAENEANDDFEIASVEAPVKMQNADAQGIVTGIIGSIWDMIGIGNKPSEAEKKPPNQKPVAEPELPEYPELPEVLEPEEPEPEPETPGVAEVPEPEKESQENIEPPTEVPESGNVITPEPGKGKTCTVVRTTVESARQFKDFYPIENYAKKEDNKLSIEFSVKVGKRGGKILLSTSKLDPEKPEGIRGFVIDLDGDRGHSSYILQVIKGTADYKVLMVARVFKKLPGIVNKNEYRDFWISWDPNGSLSFGKNGETTPLLSYEHSFRSTLNHISFTSKYEDAEWRLGCAKSLPLEEDIIPDKL